MSDNLKDERKLPSLAWTDPLPTPEDIKRWRAEIGRIQKQLLDGNEHLKKFDNIDRGFHQKQLYAGPARVRVCGNLPEFLRFGPFKPASDGTPHTHNAVVRFSNGRGCPFNDSSFDVRGIAVKLIDQNGSPCDILATNKQTFARNPEQFMKFAAADAIAQTAGDQTGWLGDHAGDPAVLLFVLKEMLAGRFNPVETARIAAALFRDTILHKTRSLATESYDGSTFRTPEGYLAKIIFTPKGETEPIDADRTNPNYLTDEIQRQLTRNGKVEFTMHIKVFTGNGDAADASDPWDPSNQYEVADLEVGGNAEIGFQTAINRMAFNPATGFEPAVMSHARKEIYEESAKNRRAMSQEEAVATIKQYFRDNDR
jgi:catalase